MLPIENLAILLLFIVLRIITFILFVSASYSQNNLFKSHPYATLGTSEALTASASFGAIDGDGDLDVLGAADDTGDNLIAWWKNDGTPLGANWNQYNIETSFNEAHSIYSADVDSDGDMDVIAAAGGTEDTIAWWENDGSQSFTKQILDSKLTF